MDQELVFEVREALVDACEAYHFEPPWDFLPPHRDVRRLPPTEGLARLEQAFSAEALAVAGVACQGPEDPLRVSPRLGSPGGLVVALRDERGRVLDLLSEAGAALTDDLPLFTALAGEPLLLGPTADEPEVLAAARLEDVAVLRGCGIPATLASGLERLGLADLDRLCAAFGLTRGVSNRLEDLAEPGEELESPASSETSSARAAQAAQAGAEDEEPPVQRKLVLVDWSPAALDGGFPAAIGAVLQHFEDLERHLDVDLIEVNAWRATPKQLERLRFLLGFRDPQCAREALLDHLFDGAYYWRQRPSPSAAATVLEDLPAALAMLRETLDQAPKDDEGVRRRAAALRQVERLVYEQVIRPLTAEAMAAPGAQERATGLAAAQLAQQFLIEGVVHAAQLQQAVAHRGLQALDGLAPERIDRWLATGDRFARVLRELERCRETRGGVVRVLPVQPSRLRVECSG